MLNGDTSSFIKLKNTVSVLVGIAGLAYGIHAIYLLSLPILSFDILTYDEFYRGLFFASAPGFLSYLFLDLVSLAAFGRVNFEMTKTKENQYEVKESERRFGLLQWFGIDKPYLKTFDTTVHNIAQSALEERAPLVAKINMLAEKLNAKKIKNAVYYTDATLPGHKSDKCKLLERNVANAKKVLNAFDDKVCTLIQKSLQKNTHLLYSPNHAEMTKARIKELIQNEFNHPLNREYESFVKGSFDLK